MALATTTELHDLHSVALAAAAGDSRDTEIVVVHCGYSAGAVRSVTRIAGPVPADRPVGDEIPAVDVVDFSVMVVIGTVLGLSWIGPHVGREVRMGVLHAFVKDCDYHVRVTCSQSPCILDIHVGPGPCIGGQGHVPRIVVMPLVLQIRVVEGKRRRSGCHACCRGIRLQVRSPLHPGVVLHLIDRIESCKRRGHEFRIEIWSERHPVPSVETVFPV